MRYYVGFNLPIVACFLLLFLGWERSGIWWLCYEFHERAPGDSSASACLLCKNSENWSLSKNHTWVHSVILGDTASRSLGLRSWGWPWTSDLPIATFKWWGDGMHLHALCMGCKGSNSGPQTWQESTLSLELPPLRSHICLWGWLDTANSWSNTESGVNLELSKEPKC